ncbi:ATPase subunit of ABC transporter with duplicated ATPase domains [Antricoccus suffuscus]|uniref:ATPase subunit of ABC transporter with duplicated ATPase domains n=1 Tax=Antricoccus suffuscus TaxID=1629062 RepID=A0A2T0ZY48_9ACTN|nr:ATP-binding cassette domain-containing protein [Antricoccus suffuscus]PRZ41167.1 ATPase subunit of ABC transporter with duplicated ATPase domains [Antricoccus suffuscus]
MSAPQTPSIICDSLTFEWPDGTTALRALEAQFDTAKIGLIGVNGAGKSTLLRLIAGRLTPTAGDVRASGEIAYLPQDLTITHGQSVGDLLDVQQQREALAAIEAGTATASDFETIGDDWDIEERVLAELSRLGLAGISLDRDLATLSGGEVVLIGLVAKLLRRPDVLLLDEPTNNLDIEARRRLYSVVDDWTGTLLIVSHDRELLRRVDQIADLTDGALRMYGGNLDDYERIRAEEDEAIEREVRTAESDVRRQKRELADARIKLDRRLRYGKKMMAQKREPKIIMNARKRAAQVSSGKHRNLHMERLADSRGALSEAQSRLRDDDEIRVDLPETAVPAGRTMLDLRSPDVNIRGPERIALLGRNGSGKTTLLNRVLRESLSPSTTRLLPQRLDVLDESVSVLDNVSRLAPTTPPAQTRNRLAQFLLRGRQVELPASTLSGGERFRAVLAALLLAEPAVQLLLLDEPTNNLDMASARQLTGALNSYQGALLVVSHDVSFLRGLEIDRWLWLDRDEGLAEIDAPVTSNHGP